MILEILQKRGLEPKKKTSKEWSSPCPFCGGKDRFYFQPDANRYRCRQCDAHGDDIQLLRDLDGLSFQQAKEAVGRGDNGGKPQVKPTKQTSHKKNGDKPFVHYKFGKPDVIYNYTDKTGKVLFHVCRFNSKTKEGEKTFSQVMPDGLTWKVKGVPLTLYHLPDLIKSTSILYAEGEKDADLLKSLDLTVTTNSGGAGKVPKQQEDHEILKPLYGKKVYIVQHNDKPGKDHAQQVAEILHGKAKEVKIIDLPGLPEKGDFSDFYEIYGKDKAVEKLVEILNKTPVWTPPKNFFSAEDLLSVTYKKKTPVIAKGIIPHNSHIIISGETGVGKSLLRLELALHLVMGWEWLGFEIPRAQKVAIFQYENSEPMEQTRLKRMCQGLGIRQIPAGRLTYVDRKNRINLTLKGDRKKLLELVKESGAEVIIYDCLSNLHSAKENDNIQMRNVLDCLTEINAILGTSCILIHHFGKPQEGQANVYRTRGASSITDWAVTAMAYTVKKNEHKILRSLEFIKVRDGAIPKPLLLERDGNFLLSVTDEDTLCPPARVKDILEGLGGTVEKQGDLVSTIVSETGCEERSARSFIKKAVDRKVIEVEKQGRTKRYYVAG